MGIIWPMHPVLLCRSLHSTKEAEKSLAARENEVAELKSQLEAGSVQRSRIDELEGTSSSMLHCFYLLQGPG